MTTKVKKLFFCSQKGLTLTELIIVLGLLAFVLSFVTLNLLNPPSQASLDTAVTTMISDIRQQQLKAMVGDTEGDTTSHEYGVRFESGSYTLFRGNFGNNNFVTDLKNDLVLSFNLPSQDLTFAKMSGEVNDYNPSQNSISVTNLNTGQIKTISINKFGRIEVN